MRCAGVLERIALHVVMMTFVQPTMKVEFDETVEEPDLEEEEEEEGEEEEEAIGGVDMGESLGIKEGKIALAVLGGAKGKVVDRDRNEMAATRDFERKGAIKTTFLGLSGIVDLRQGATPARAGNGAENAEIARRRLL